MNRYTQLLNKVRRELEKDKKDVNESIHKTIVEGLITKLLFKSDLAMELYREFYIDLIHAIEDGNKAKAQELLDEFVAEFEEDKDRRKPWTTDFYDAHEKMQKDFQKQIDNLPDEKLTEDWDEYDDDYYDLDPVEEDRAFAALYGGDRIYCDCGKRKVPDEDGYYYCPDCEKSVTEF